MTSRSAIYRAVFPTATESEAATPTATPLVDTGAFDVPDTAPRDTAPEDLAGRTIRYQRAWHESTTYLTLPRRAISLEEAVQDDEEIERLWMPACPTTTSDAISYVVNDPRSYVASAAVPDGYRKLIDWYRQEVTNHFVDLQLPVLTEVLNDQPGGEPLAKVVRILQTSQMIYFHRLQHAILPQAKATAQRDFARFRDRHHALVANALADTPLREHLSVFLYSQSHILFAGEGWRNSEDTMQVDLPAELETAVASTKRILITLDDVGLGGAPVQRVLAEVVDDGLTTYVANEYSEVGMDSHDNSESLRAWVDERLAPLVTNAVTCLSDLNQPGRMNWEQELPNEVLNWKERAIHELAALRLEEAFDIIVDWQTTVPSGLSDLNPYTKSMAGRAFIINRFSMTVALRLLQPGASTIEILQMYVHIIMAFLELDSKGVLLDRISRPLRRYLRDRSDTVKTIIQGLLLGSEPEAKEAEPMSELARVLNELQERQDPRDDADDELYDLNWEPDPVDAAVEYKADERGEIIGSLIDIFDNKDIFVKEFQNMLSDILLQSDHKRQREIQVLELFKKRIGDSHLQACEVMLNDMNESERTDEFILQNQGIRAEGVPFRTKILSRFYWPSLQPENFKIPDKIQKLQDEFSNGFEHYKPSRKLTWLNSLGRAKVELHLKDRVVEESVHTWQASVINAFASASETSSTVSKSAGQLIEELEMDEDLVHAALNYWVGKMVLLRKGESYSVLEELPSGTIDSVVGANHTDHGISAAAAAASASSAAAEVGSVRRNDEKVAEEKMAVFWQFIQNMLRNQGAMPLPKMVKTLKFVVQGGFPFTNEDLKAFLAKRVESGQLELSGGNYKLGQSA